MDQATKTAVLDQVFERLNGEQHEAASVTSGELMIAAGAGTGKTYTLTAHYIANALALDEPRVDRILAITYTRAAAGELAARIRAALESSGAEELARQMGGAWISTFHSFCIRVLRAEATALVGPDTIDPHFVELDELEAASLLSQSVNAVFESWAISRPDEIRALLYAKKRSAVKASIAALLATCKTYGVTVDAAVVDPSLIHDDFPWEVRARGLLTTFIGLAADVERHYAAAKRARSALDFADLITKVDHLFSSYPDIAASYRDRFTRILVDEFQDTNHLQYRIVKAMSRDNITRVGDRAQSIYGFQGAQADVFDLAVDDVRAAHARGAGYPPLSLSTNYRSHAGVLSFVNHTFTTAAMFGGGGIVELAAGREESNPKFNRHQAADSSTRGPRVEVTTVTTSGSRAGDPIAAAYQREAAAVADRIRGLLDAPGSQLTTADIVVVLRARTYAQAHVDALMARGIPAYILGGRGLLRDTAVRAAISLLKVIDNPRDEAALIALLISDFGRVSDQALATVALARRVGEAGRSLWDALTDPLVEVPAADREAIDGLVATVEQASQAHGILSLEAILKAAIAQRGVDLGLIAPLAGGAPNLAGHQSYANLMHFADMAREWEEAGGSLRGFLEDLAQKASEREQLELADWEGDPNDAGAVRVMTIHGTKGLEYPVVAAAFGSVAPDSKTRGMARLRWDSPRLGAGRIVVSTTLSLPDDELNIVKERAEAEFGTTGTSAIAKKAWGVGTTPTDRLFKSLEYSSAGAQERLKELEELKRLAYVATTRARDVLLVSYQALSKTACSSEAVVQESANLSDLIHASLCDRYIQGEWPDFEVRPTTPSPIAYRCLPLPATEPSGGAGAAAGGESTTAGTGRTAGATAGTKQAGAELHLEYERPRAPRDTQLAQISASHIKTLRDCPRQFYLKYREGLGTLRYTGASSAANLGNALHGIMQHSWREDRPAADVVARVAGVYRLPADEADQVAAIATKLLATDLLTEIRGASAGDPAVTLAAAEYQFYEHLSGDLNGDAREVYLQGFIDLLALGEDGVASIVDYKTGQGSASPERYRTQAACYGLVALRAGATSARVAFMMPEASESIAPTIDRGVPVHWFTFTQSDREALERSVLEAHRDMERAGTMGDAEIEEWLAGNAAAAKAVGDAPTEPCYSCGYDGPLCAVGARRHRGRGVRQSS